MSQPILLKWQVTLRFGSAIVLVASLAVVSILFTRRFAQYANQSTQDQEVVAQLNAVLSTVTDVETSLRGYTISGDEAYLAPYRVALVELGPLLNGLTGQRRSEAWESDHLARLALLIEARLAIAADVIEQRRARGFEAARQAVVEGSGRRTHDLIRLLLADLAAQRVRELQSRAAIRQRAERWSLGLAAASGLAALAILGGGLLLARRGFAAMELADERLREANANLRLAAEQAQAADRLKSAFLATMSHELRTPLNSVIGFTGVMLQELPGPLNPEQAKQLGIVQDSARHLLALINDVLDISKIEAGEMRLHREPFDVRASAEKVTGISSPLASQKGLALHVRLAPGLGQVTGDRRRTEQILLNLLNNAIKFTEHGEVSLTADGTPDLIRFHVADTGIGISPEDAQHLFLPFRQVDSGLARGHEGTGLGLAISRRLADMMGGTIRVESAVGRGSVFTFELPRTAPGQS